MPHQSILILPGSHIHPTENNCFLLKKSSFRIHISLTINVLKVSGNVNIKKKYKIYLKYINPSESSCTASKLQGDRYLMCSEAFLADICQSEIHGICKKEFVISESDHADNRITSPVRYPCPVISLVIHSG